MTIQEFGMCPSENSGHIQLCHIMTGVFFVNYLREKVGLFFSPLFMTLLVVAQPLCKPIPGIKKKRQTLIWQNLVYQVLTLLSQSLMQIVK